MRRWRILGILLSLVTVCCLVLAAAVITSDGGDVRQFKKQDMPVAAGGVANPIDWKKLKGRNPDIYAWIEIPGTAVDYPVLQSASDQEEDYYLNHNYSGSYGIAGSIYSQKGTARDFSDPVTILYGHNMANGSMFAGIRKFEEAGFFKEHDTAYIYLPEKILVYKIISYYVADNSHIQDAWHPEKKEGFREYIRTIMSGKQGGNIRKGTELSVSGHILTLSTCSSAGNSRRLLQNVLVEEQITE